MQGGEEGFSPTQSLPEPEGSPMTLHLTRHVSPHMPFSSRVRCHVPCRRMHKGQPSPHGYCRTLLLLLSSATRTSQLRCHGKSNSICLCGKWPPEWWSLEHRAHSSQAPLPPCSLSEAGSTSRQSKGSYKVNSQKVERHQICDFYLSTSARLSHNK